MKSRNASETLKITPIFFCRCFFYWRGEFFMAMLVWYWLYKLHYNVLVENILSSPNRAVGFLVVNRVNCQSSFRSCGHQCNQLEGYFSTPLNSWSLTRAHTYDAFLHIYIEIVYANIHQIQSLSTSLTTHHTWQVLLKKQMEFLGPAVSRPKKKIITKALCHQSYDRKVCVVHLYLKLKNVNGASLHGPWRVVDDFQLVPTSLLDVCAPVTSAWRSHNSAHLPGRPDIPSTWAGVQCDYCIFEKHH